MAGRVLQPELMDDPGLDAAEHAHALRGLARINRLSGAGRVHLPALRMAWARSGGPVRVLDVASGSGDGAVALLAAAQREGIACSLTVADVSERAVAAACDRARSAGIDASGVVVDAVSGPLPEADLVVCSLFLHHLTEDQVASLLTNMRACVRGGGDGNGGVVSINDLRRGAWGTALADVAPRLVTRSRVVHTDASISARSAFTPRELLELADRAGMRGASVRPCFPARMSLVWDSTGATA